MIEKIVGIPNVPEGGLWFEGKLIKQIEQVSTEAREFYSAYRTPCGKYICVKVIDD